MSTAFKFFVETAIVGGILAAGLGCVAYFTQPEKTVFHITRPEKRAPAGKIYPLVSSSDVVIYHRRPAGVTPYNERTLAQPYNPGPGFIFAPVPDTVTNHVNLNLPDPVCLAGCRKRR